MILGTVPYLNALPLTCALPENHLLVSLTPTELVKSLLKDHLVAGLVPCYSIFEHGLKAYPEAGLIGCDGEVKSVGFFTRDHIRDLSEINSIYFDHESQSSVRLAQIVLSKMFGRNLKSIKTVSLPESHQADALMLIGDKALFFREDGYRYWDLGKLWKELTGFGFVFACWASLKGLSQECLKTLSLARESGLKQLPDWIERPQNPRDQLSRNYLTQNLVYEFTPSLRQGLDQYREWLQDLDLIGASLKRRVA